MRWYRLLFAIVLVGTPPMAKDRPAADLIIQNARIWTVDPARPEAEAVAVLGDRIVAVGSTADVDAWRGPRTRVFDAAGRRLLPGFNDAHVHFIDGGAQLESVELKDAATPQEFARRIGQQAAKTPKGAWVLNGEWDEMKWSPPALPTKELIDPVTPEHSGSRVAIRRPHGCRQLAGAEAGGNHCPIPPIRRAALSSAMRRAIQRA